MDCAILYPWRGSWQLPEAQIDRLRAGPKRIVGAQLTGVEAEKLSVIALASSEQIARL